MPAGDLPRDVKSLHEHYGEIVRIGPDELSFTDPAAWKEIYTKDFLRPWMHRDKPPGKDAENLISASEEDHSRFRKVLAPAFVQTSDQEAVVQSYVDLLIKKLRQEVEVDRPQEGAMVDVLKWFSYATFDIVGEPIWGSSFGCLETVKYHPWIQVIAQSKTAYFVGATKYYTPLDTILTMITPKSAMADLMEIWKTTEEKIAQRIELGPSHEDMISHMLETKKSTSSMNVQMSLPEVESNSMMIVVAGSESVTTVLTGITNYLLRDPSKLQALVREVRSNFQSNDQITGLALSRLPYLNAVLHEGLRVCPTIPDGMRREIPKGGALIAGHFLRQGTVVSIPQWASYQTPKNFHSPTLFAPERWLEGSADSRYSKDRKDVFQPFFLGPHNCPGRSLAYLEMRLILAKIIWNFDLKVPKGVALPEWEAQKVYWFWEKQATFARLNLAT